MAHVPVRYDYYKLGFVDNNMIFGTNSDQTQKLY